MSENTSSSSTDNSTSAITFTLILYILYFMYLKPVLTLEIINDRQKYDQAIKGIYASTGILFVCVISLQLIFNAIGFQSKCQGDFIKNFGKVFSSTFFPWFIIMGSVMTALLVAPGFKGAFSNVLGYYAVANSANDILVSLLVPSSNDDSDNKEISSKDGEMSKTAEAIMKIAGNTSLLINQITPSNFVEFWDGIIVPLMKPEYKEDSSQANELKEKLLENVILRDNIGEACWYIYTTILLVTVVKSNIAEIPCQTSVAAIHERVNKVNKKQDKIDLENKKKESVTYKT